MFPPKPPENLPSKNYIKQKKFTYLSARASAAFTDAIVVIRDPKGDGI